MTNRGLYEVLGVSPSANDQEIKKAYRRLAQMYHPDKHSGDKFFEEKFKEIKDAYDVLSDRNKRARYDRTSFGGRGGDPWNWVRTRPSAQTSNPFTDLFEDLISDIFTAPPGGRPPRPQRGSDIQHTYRITFLESYYGVSAKIRIPRMETCSFCFGTGARRGTNSVPCSACKGKGEVILEKGLFKVTKTCEECGGEGKVVRNPCSSCVGSGKVNKVRGFSIQVPPGVVNGTQLKLPGEGEAGVRNGPPGDLFIDIQVEPHPLFKRESNDVCIDLSLSFPQAALGCTVDVPTLTGTVPLIIPAGTQPNQVFTLTGRGFPDMKKKELGDQRVRVTVETPVNMTEQQRRLIEKLASMNGPRIDPKRVTILSKIKTLIGYVR